MHVVLNCVRLAHWQSVNCRKNDIVSNSILNGGDERALFTVHEPCINEGQGKLYIIYTFSLCPPCISSDPCTHADLPRHWGQCGLVHSGGPSQRLPGRGLICRWYSSVCVWMRALQRGSHCTPLGCPRFVIQYPNFFLPSHFIHWLGHSDGKKVLHHLR